MTPSPRITQDPADLAGSERCTVCDHQLTEHDSISLRDCHATQAQAHSRACICPPHPHPRQPARPSVSTGAAGVNQGATYRPRRYQSRPNPPGCALSGTLSDRQVDTTEACETAHHLLPARPGDTNGARPVNLDNHILNTLRARAADDRPVTIGDLARQLGANPAVVLDAARRLVDNGQATPSMISVHGVPTLRGLLLASSTAS